MTASWPRPLPILALIGIAGTVVALFIDPATALAAYLAALVAASAVPTGASAVLMISYLVRGRWTNELHVPLTAATLLIPLAGLMFLPILAGLPWLYPWVHHRPEDAFKAVYLTPWFFVLRNVIYFVVWTVIAFWVRRAWANVPRMTRAASAGLIVYALTASFAAVDWIESLTPQFHSSIYGLLVMTFQVLTGLSFGIVAAFGFRPRYTRTSGYGALLLATLLLWAYMHAMQYIIIWAGNMPDEVEWYLSRSRGAWGGMLWSLVAFQFVLPFFALLSERVRNRSRPLVAIAAGTLVLRFVEALLLVLPAAGAHGAVLWLAVPATLATAIGVLGTALLVILARLERSAADARPLPATSPAT